MSNNMDYVLPDGTIIEVDIKESNLPELDVTKLSGKELEQYCVRLFSDFGWDVKQEQIIKLETGNVAPDLVLGDEKKDYGFVEIVSSNDPHDVISKKETLECIIDSCKPDVCILTNGIVFDIFYKGKYAGTKNTPPTYDDVKRAQRLMAYAEALNKMRKNDE